MSFLNTSALARFLKNLKANLDKKVNTDDLAAVATSGSYDDLTDTPDSLPADITPIEISDDKRSVSIEFDDEGVFSVIGNAEVKGTLTADGDAEVEGGLAVGSTFSALGGEVSADKSEYAALHIRDARHVRDTAPTDAAQYDDAVVLEDSSGTRVAYLRQPFLTDGKEGVQLETSRVIDGSNVYNGIQMYIAADGTRSVLVSDKTAWRNAIINPWHNAFAITSHAVKAATSLAGGSYFSDTTAITRSGCYALGVVGWHCNSRYGNCGRAYLSGQGNGTATINWMTSNIDDDSSHSVSLTVYVLWTLYT